MRGGNVPGAGVRRGIGAEAEVDGGLRFREGFTELQIGGGVVNGIRGCQENHRLDGRALEIGGERGDIAEAFGSRLESGNTGADVFEGKIDREREVLHGGGLAGTGDDGGFRTASLEIRGEFLHPLELFGVGDRGDARSFNTKLAGDLSGKCDDHARRNTQTVIRHAAGEGEGGLHRVEAVH